VGDWVVHFFVSSLLLSQSNSQFGRLLQDGGGWKNEKMASEGEKIDRMEENKQVPCWSHAMVADG
jgi:hypothetical protein